MYNPYSNDGVGRKHSISRRKQYKMRRKKHAPSLRHMRLVFQSADDEVVFLLCSENASLSARNRQLCEELSESKRALKLCEEAWSHRFEGELKEQIRLREAEICMQVHLRDTEFLK